MNGDCVQPVPLVMTVETAAEILCTTPEVVIRYVHAHKLEAIQIGRERRIRGEDLVDFVRSRATTCDIGKKSGARNRG